MPDPVRIALIRRFRAEGASWAEIGAALGIHATSAASYARLRCPDALGPLRRRPRRSAGLPEPSAKLRRIQSLRAEGWSWQRIGDALGLRPSAAWHYAMRYDGRLRVRPAKISEAHADST